MGAAKHSQHCRNNAANPDGGYIEYQRVTPATGSLGAHCDYGWNAGIIERQEGFVKPVFQAWPIGVLTCWEAPYAPRRRDSGRTRRRRQ
jgi:hypothetical protein